ncbi:hypothetical protein KC853_02170 [Candidatus Saccharibacteria bacterium]|nr:hypothetical protein [Candidatus Saccharibacteria bacterium]MCB9834562.1 hypothetical protein [Candidatus Nomurabacteria bacterium]
MKLNFDVFKSYDIRGLVEDVSPRLAFLLGKAGADYFSAGIIVVGRDMRPESQELASSIIEGLVVQGRQVVDLGLVTTDMLNFSIAKFGYSGGFMVTASHNPGVYSGIKVSGGLRNGCITSLGLGTGLEVLRDKIINQEFNPTSDQSGKVENKEVLDIWIDHCLGVVGNLSKIKLGYDSGNGMAGIFVDQLKQKTKLELDAIYQELDGSFPNHPAYPMLPQNMRDLAMLVQDKKLDLGVGFDGDGDRAFFVDNYGDFIDGNLTAIVLVLALRDQYPDKKLKLVHGIRISRNVLDLAKRLGIETIISKAGYLSIREAMISHQADLGVESSGHYYFADNYMIDSGLLTTLKVIKYLEDKKLTLAEIRRRFVSYDSSGEINLEVEAKDQVLEALAGKYSDKKLNFLDGVSIDSGDWWANIRASNTEPYLRINLESKSQELTSQALTELVNFIEGQ